MLGVLDLAREGTEVQIPPHEQVGSIRGSPLSRICVIQSVDDAKTTYATSLAFDMVCQRFNFPTGMTW